eukprot:300369_1
MLSFLSSLYMICLVHSEFHCWPQSERKMLTFDNSNKSMEQFPTIRFIQGYWDSQWALQYIGYLYVKEKMGLNVEFFPKLSSGLTLDNFSPYPDFYWDEIANNNYDILLEQWPNLDGMDHFYDSGSVIYGGINDIYGEIGQFVPDYVYDELIEGTLPKELKHNTVLRQQFIDAYTKNSYSGRDWVKYLNDTLYSNNETLATYLNKSYALPTYDKPIIWGSKMTYIMSKYTQNITQYFQIYNDSTPGLDWIFCPLLSESILSEFMIDMYENKQPFIASLYYPHPDFATISKRTGMFMRFEHIFIHRNDDNSREAECYVKYQCKEPLGPLFKLGNPLLGKQLPEILAFLYDFSILADDLNDIIYHRKALDDIYSDIDMSSHDKWLNASCQWLKANTDITTEFHQDIIRYDCSEFDGCGFTYYFDNEYNKIIAHNIGGYCANSSIEPLCICTDKYLTGNDCRRHCDGLLGPYYNSTNDTYYFRQCSGNGICEISRQKCQCFKGFNGDGCEIVFEQFIYSTSLQILFLILFLICIIILFLSIIWLWINQKYKTVKALSARMTTLFTTGLILLCVGTICYLFHPLNDISCNIRQYCYGLGAILTIMAPLCKTYRVAIIFAQARNLKKIEFPDKKLAIYLINGVAIEFVICVLYTILHEVNGGVSNIYLNEYNRIETLCNQSESVTYVQAGNYLYIFTLIVLLCFFSFKNRDTHKVFKESRCAYFGSFFTLFVFIVVVIFNAVVDDIYIIITIQSGAMLIALSVIWVLFYGIRIYKFYKYPNDRSNVDVSASINKKKINYQKNKKDKMQKTG